MKIRDRYTGKEAPGDWLPADDMEVDVKCPECEAEIGEQCNYEDLENKGMGVEIGSFVHASRVHEGLRPEFDWEETIMNQRMRIEELEKQLRDAGDAMAVQDERNEELRAALEELVDWHNGPPLRTWAKDWRAAMKRAYQLLGREVDKLPGDE